MHTVNDTIQTKIFFGTGAVQWQFQQRVTVRTVPLQHLVSIPTVRVPPSSRDRATNAMCCSIHWRKKNSRQFILPKMDQEKVLRYLAFANMVGCDAMRCDGMPLAPYSSSVSAEFGSDFCAWIYHTWYLTGNPIRRTCTVRTTSKGSTKTP